VYIITYIETKNNEGLKMTIHSVTFESATKKFMIETYRDKCIFGTWRASTQVYFKKGYRIKDGKIEVKHSGKWYEFEEVRESSTDYIKKLNDEIGSTHGVCGKFRYICK